MTYLFCYGSLVNLEVLAACLSVDVDNIISRVHFVRVSKICRGWLNNYDPDLKINGLTLKPTYLTAFKIQNTKITCTGLLIKLNDDEVEIVDKRELSSCYSKEKIDPNDIIEIKNFPNTDNNFDPTSQIYYYCNNSSMCSLSNKSCSKNLYIASAKHPIVQSYVDICCNGWLMIDLKFGNKNFDLTNEFVIHTYFWNTEWLNDRIYKYRPFIFEPNAFIINGILEKHLGDLLNKIK